MSDATVASVYHVLFKIVSLLCDHAAEVVIRTQPAGDDLTFYVKVHPEDRTRLTSGGGQKEEAIRTILGGAGARLHRNFRLVLVDTFPAADAEEELNEETPEQS